MEKTRVRVVAEVTGYTLDMGKQILRKAFPKASPEEIEHFLTEWPRTQDGHLEPSHRWATD